MQALPDVVITGIGIVSPIGIGRDAFWSSLMAGRSGIDEIRHFDSSRLPVRIAAEVDGFEPTKYVAKRKQLKIMCRDAQLGVAAAALACESAGISAGAVDPERFGVVLGADRICSAHDEAADSYRPCILDGAFEYDLWATRGMAGTFPLSFLRVLPNMIASHISIAHDARGPNNTIHQAEVSGILAIGEALRTIQRGAADVMLAGGASSQMKPFDCVRRCCMGILSSRQDDPAAAARPFDADRDGQVWGEGAATFVLENRRHAEARGAEILGRILSVASTCAPPKSPKTSEGPRRALQRAIENAVGRADLNGRGLSHVNAHGLSAVTEDRLEAQVLRHTVPDVPVFAPKSYFGNLGAAAGAVEAAVSVLALQQRVIPPTLNYDRPDPACPLQVVRREPTSTNASRALLLNWTSVGQAATAVIAGPN